MICRSKLRLHHTDLQHLHSSLVGGDLHASSIDADVKVDSIAKASFIVMTVYSHQHLQRYTLPSRKPPHCCMGLKAVVEVVEAMVAFKAVVAATDKKEFITSLVCKHQNKGHIADKPVAAAVKIAGERVRDGQATCTSNKIVDERKQITCSWISAM